MVIKITNCQIVQDDSISVIRMNDKSMEDRIEEQNEELDHAFLSQTKNILQIILMVFGILAACILTAVPWTLVPRTNSIFYQSSWMEILLPSTTCVLIYAGNAVVNLRIWTKEKQLISEFDTILRPTFWDRS